jgi:hypothetical protein
MAQPTITGIEPTLAEALVGDPLSEVTRKTRLYLLAVSLVGVAMVMTGLVPTKIATFGIELEQPNRNALLFLIAFVNLYFLVAFIIYAVSDFRKWLGQVEAARESNDRALRFRMVGYDRGSSEEAVRRGYDAGELALDYEMSKWGGKTPQWLIEQATTEELMQLINESESPIKVQMSTIERKTDKITGYLRGLFEFVLPILVGLFSICALLFRIFCV